MYPAAQRLVERECVSGSEGGRRRDRKGKKGGGCPIVIEDAYLLPACTQRKAAVWRKKGEMEKRGKKWCTGGLGVEKQAQCRDERERMREYYEMGKEGDREGGG